MARFNVQCESPATLAVDTGFAWLYPVAGNGFKVRRVTVGCTTTTAVVPTSQQVTLGLNRTTNAGTTPGGGMTANKLDPNSAAAGSVFSTTFATPPTLTANDFYRVAFNTQSGADLPFEMLEELVVAAGTTAGLAFINRDLALPTNHKIVLSVEFEE